MKKKAILFASMGVLACTVGITALVIGGTNQLDTFAVKADPIEYSVTFNESNTTVEAFDGNYAIGTTTDNGSKVGVLGWYNEEASFTFKGYSFNNLLLHHYEMFTEGDAYPFSTITGFAISFSSGEEEGEPVPADMTFRYGEEMIYHIESGTSYKGLSIIPEDMPEFLAMGEGVAVTSLTIYYTC